jgi:8-oxo-dGTP diphosphatase/2-hydroxy-dATP diphosphatase
MKNVVTTLCVVHQHPRVLLGMKKRGFGAGRWNGFGGKLMPGESIKEAAWREMKEEAGVEVKNHEKVGIIHFEWKGNEETMEMHVFRADNFTGEPVESEEMKPEWFFIDEIPFHAMWPDDIYWMPLFLKGKKFKGKFLFGEGDVVLQKELEEVGEI